MNELKFPLVTDLDDTMLATDSLLEGFCRMLCTSPLQALKILLLLREGALACKHAVTPYTLEITGSLPFNAPVLECLRAAHADGRPLYLATASPHSVAEAVAAASGLAFADIFASDRQRNLKGEAKARLLAEKFPQGFVYIGDSLADVPVWRAAAGAIVASSSPTVIAAARKANATCEVLPVHQPGWRDVAHLFRVRQWVKNLLVFLPLLLAHTFADWAYALAAFGSLCLGASAIYVFNDLCDLTNDRVHPRKRARPLAAGTVPLRWVPALFVGALTLSFAPCLWLPQAFIGCLLLYLATTIGYSLAFKRMLMVDVIVLTCLYVLRVVAGAAALGLGLSNWLLAFCLFFFLGLALLKRVGGLTSADGECMYGRAYTSGDRATLVSMAAACAFVSTVVIALYVDSLAATRLYSHPGILWYICPLLLYWYGRIIVLAQRGQLADDPVAFTVRDRASHLTALLVLFLFMLAL